MKLMPSRSSSPAPGILPSRPPPCGTVVAVAPQTDAVDLTDEQLIERIEQLRRGVDEGTLPLWTGEEPLADYVGRARTLRR